MHFRVGCITIRYPAVYVTLSPSYLPRAQCWIRPKDACAQDDYSIKWYFAKYGGKEATFVRSHKMGMQSDCMSDRKFYPSLKPTLFLRGFSTKDPFPQCFGIANDFLRKTWSLKAALSTFQMLQLTNTDLLIEVGWLPCGIGFRSLYLNLAEVTLSTTLERTFGWSFWLWKTSWICLCPEGNWSWSRLQYFGDFFFNMMMIAFSICHFWSF